MEHRTANVGLCHYIFEVLDPLSEQRDEIGVE